VKATLSGRERGTAKRCENFLDKNNSKVIIFPDMKAPAIPRGEKYRNLGIKLTPQRIAILDYLEGNLSHPSAEDVYKAVLRKYPTMSFATIYNTLETLKRNGMVAELTGDPEKKRFDPNPRPHHHLICTRCRRIVDVQVEFRLPVPDRDRAGFEITGNHIEFFGTCPACKKRTYGSPLHQTAGNLRSSG
jgi:Fur family transcriptional regulator, peroxide stress response regulator